MTDAERKKLVQKLVRQAFPDCDAAQRRRITAGFLNPYSPMKKFEQSTGLKGLSFDYRMPMNASASLVETDYEITRLGCQVSYNGRKFDFEDSATDEQREKYLSYTAKLISSLKRLNPELSSIRVEWDNIDQAVDFILGVTSGYLPEDISYYLTKSWDQTHWLKTPHIDELNKKLTAVYNRAICVGGVVSPATTRKICEQLNHVHAGSPKP